MSELGNILRTLRGDFTQKQVARSSRLSERTLMRAELGDAGTSLDTIRKLATHYKLPKAERAAILVAWLRIELGDDFELLDVRSRSPGKVRLTDFDKFVEQFRQVPRHLQRELTNALKHKEVLNSVAAMNQLAERLRRESASKPDDTSS